MPGPLSEVTKRGGRTELYQPAKITRSILRAAESRGQGDRFLAEELAAVVTMVLEQDEPGLAPATSDVREVVERVLMETGHVDVARSFILHGDRSGRRGEVEAPEASASAPSVLSSSRECRLAWDRSRICSHLVLQLGLDSEAAEAVAREVERRVLALGLPSIRGAMLEDLVELALLERGHSKAGASQQRVGLSRRLLDRVVRDRREGRGTEARVGEEVLRRYSLSALFEQDVADAHLDAELELDGLGNPRRALTASLVLGDLRRGVSCGQGVAAVVRIARELQDSFSGPLHLGHVERMLLPALESEDEIRSVVRQLLLGLSEARSPGRRAPARVLILGAGLPRDQLARMFHRRHSPEGADRRVRRFLREMFAQTCRLSSSLALPRLRVLLPQTELGPGSVDPVLAASQLGPDAVRGMELGLVELGRPAQELRPLQVLGARVGVNAVRVALRCGRRRSAEFLAALRPVGRRAVDAGARRLKFMIELDEAGVGPLHRLEDLVEELSPEVAIDLPGRHGYHCSIVPVGLDAAVRAITEKDPEESEEAAQLRTEALEALHSVLPENTGSAARFELSLESFARAERRLGRADFVSFPRGRDILRLSHDGEAFRYGSSEFDRSPRVLDPSVDDLWTPSSMELDLLAGSDGEETGPEDEPRARAMSGGVGR